MNARERFEATRRAIPRLHDVQLAIMYECDDWKPPAVKAHTQTADPTASRAIYRVDELSEKLDALRAEERELTQLIGETLAIIAAVRVGFGEIYASLLEWRYVDGKTIKQISDDKKINRTYCYQLIDIVFDWIDSVGVSKLLRGQHEL